MSNPAPSSGGGMPKWLIVVLVLVIIIALGCCGGFVACHWACKVAGTAISQGEQKVHDLATQKADELKRQEEERQREQGGPGTGTAPENPGSGAGGGGNGGSGAGAGGASGTGGSGGAGAAGSGGGPVVIPGGMGGGVPANFPKDVPVMNGMTPTGFSEADNLRGSGFAQFTSKDKPADVAAYYDKQMKDQGWTETENLTVGGTATLIFTKDNRTASVQALPDADHTTVRIQYATKQ